LLRFPLEKKLKIQFTTEKISNPETKDGIMSVLKLTEFHGLNWK